MCVEICILLRQDLHFRISIHADTKANSTQDIFGPKCMECTLDLITQDLAIAVDVRWIIAEFDSVQSLFLGLAAGLGLRYRMAIALYPFLTSKGRIGSLSFEGCFEFSGLCLFTSSQEVLKLFVHDSPKCSNS